MTTRLPLVAAQPGIWMAEKLSTLPSAWSVAHYVELHGTTTLCVLQIWRWVMRVYLRYKILPGRYKKGPLQPSSALTVLVSQHCLKVSQGFWLR